MGHKSLAAYDINSLFPLYLYPKPEQDHLLDVDEPTDAPGGRRPNLAKEFINDLSSKLKMTFIPDGKGDLGAGRGTGVPPVIDHGQDSHTTSGTGISPMDNHGQDGHATSGTGVPPVIDHGQDAHATELHIRQGAYLPHWTQEKAIYFVTFRLADSLPRSTLAEIEAERKRLTTKARKRKKALSHSEKQQMTALFSERVEKYLDQGAGECYLSDQRVAAVLRAALLHFEGERYRLLAWCIMPNHVHVVVRPEPGHELSDILHSWKSFTAKKANKLLKREGRFWQPEYYDHLIRDEKDLGRCIEYTYYNPEKADLKEWRWRGYFDNAGHKQHDCGTGILPANNHGQDDHATSGTGVSPVDNHGQDDHATSGTGVLPVNNHGQDGHATGTFGPEDVFNYMYAVFHSPTYRSQYSEFLKTDFPRLPLTSKQPLFRALCGLGEELVGLHLMEKQVPPKTKFDVAGDNHVEKVRYTEPGQAAPTGRIWINREQYFDNVPQNVWEFHIGGYQVCQKWLKDRKGRKLSYDDLQHYRCIVSSLTETIRLMAEIDRTIDKHGGWPIQ